MNRSGKRLDDWRRRGVKNYEARLRKEGKKYRRIGRNQARQKREFERAYGGEARVRWGKARRCDVCGRRGTKRFPNQNAHVKTGGTGRKADAKWTITACFWCHQGMHVGQETFAREHGVDLMELAKKVDEEWSQSREL